MAEMQTEEFKFPDEAEAEVQATEDQGKPVENDLEIEIEDDTPEEDRGRTPTTPEKVKALLPANKPDHCPTGKSKT